MSNARGAPGTVLSSTSWVPPRNHGPQLPDLIPLPRRGTLITKSSRIAAWASPAVRACVRACMHAHVHPCVRACVRASRNVSPEPLRLGILANGSAGELALLVRPLRGWKHQGPAVARGSLLVTPARVSAKRDCFTEVGPPAAVVGPFTGVPAVLAGRRSRTGVAPPPATAGLGVVREHRQGTILIRC